MLKNAVILDPSEDRIHVVLLGAGASCAACPNGDKNGKELPTMDKLIRVVNLEPILENTGIDLNRNFEEIYAEILDDTIINKLNKTIREYFTNLQLPDKATHYDRLLLSLRAKDVIFTFNWDPFLYDAYERNKHVCELPQIFFLHGNVRIQTCENPNCEEFGKEFPLSKYCSKCMRQLNEVPLLYPIKTKNYYTSSQYTSRTRDLAGNLFEYAFTFSVFGYSAPKSDYEAINIISSSWYKRSKREMHHVEVIDVKEGNIVEKAWSKFTPTRHLQTIKCFTESRIWQYPRRSCESLYSAMSKGSVNESFPPPNVTL